MLMPGIKIDIMLPDITDDIRSKAEFSKIIVAVFIEAVYDMIKDPGRIQLVFLQ